MRNLDLFGQGFFTLAGPQVVQAGGQLAHVQDSFAFIALFRLDLLALAVIAVGIEQNGINSRCVTNRLIVLYGRNL